MWSAGHALHVDRVCSAGVACFWGWARFARQRREATGQVVPVVTPGLAIVIAVARCSAGSLGGAPTGLDIPEKTEINVIGGGAVTPEFLTVLIGLTLYTAAYIAEIVRAGIQAVAYGQHEAARGARAHARRRKCGWSCCRRRCA